MKFLDCNKANKKINAFTLAETLIALAIIGVIAALTIPGTVINYQKRVKVAKIKKAYNTVNQAYILALKDNGPIPKEMYVGTPGSRNLGVFYEKYIKPYYKIKKYCPPGNRCGYSAAQPFKTLNNNIHAWRFYESANFAIEVEEGIMYMIQPYNGCVGITIDINGINGPNMFGKDVFSAGIFPPKLYIPSGDNKTQSELLSDCSSASKTSTGFYCLARIIRDGWEIKDDYPW